MPVLEEGEVLGAQVHCVIEFPVTDFEVVVIAGEGIYWRCAKHASVNEAISSKRLAQAGYYSILDRYESLHLCG